MILFVMTDFANPHDKFFKEIFSRPDVARDFLIHYLPAGLSRLLVSDSIALTKDTNINHALREQFSDLLYLAKILNGLFDRMENGKIM
jgi:predicted transposase/invertase (TIGR01784 family)